MASMLIAHFPNFDLAAWRWPHFSPRELACRCGGHFCAGDYWHDEGFLDALEALRTAPGREFLASLRAVECIGRRRDKLHAQDDCR